MQDRYAGDVGDFMKLSLLKTLAGDDLRLGINWYLNTGGREGDGRHITYLKPDNRIGQSLRLVDDELYCSLQSFAEKGADRSVQLLEQRSTLRFGSIFYANPIGDRTKWHQEALARLKVAELVFLDPDNGLTMSGADPNPRKHVLPNEVRDYIKYGKSVVVYHHADRSCSVDEQVLQRLESVRESTDIEPLAAVIARRGTVRFFLVIAQPEHKRQMVQRLIEYDERAWGPSKAKQHARVVWRHPAP